MAFLLRKCFEKLGRSGIALFGGGLARRSEPLVPCGRLRGVACVIAHDAAPDAKDERSGAARVIDHDAAPRALDECGRATLPITTRPAAQWLAGCGSGSGILVGFLRKPIFAQTRPDRGRPVSPRGVPPADELSAGGDYQGGRWLVSGDSLITTRPAARWRPASSITTRTPARLTNAAGRLCS